MMLCIQSKCIEKRIHQEVEEVEVEEAVFRRLLLCKGRKYQGNQCLLYILSVFLRQTFQKLGRKVDTKLALFLTHR